MANHTFEMDLIFEPTGDAMEVSFEFETDNPDDVIHGPWPDGFLEAVLNNISIVPHSYDDN